HKFPSIIYRRAEGNVYPRLSTAALCFVLPIRPGQTSLLSPGPRPSRYCLGQPNEEMTGHGFRSVASTLLHEQGWNHQAIERQLAHAERNAVSAAYNFAEHLPERRKMMQAWADYLDALFKRA